MIVVSCLVFFVSVELIVQVCGFGVNEKVGRVDFEYLWFGQMVFGLQELFWVLEFVQEQVSKGVIVMVLEMILWILCVQSMDVLLLMVMFVGYKVVLFVLI